MKFIYITVNYQRAMISVDSIAAVMEDIDGKRSHITLKDGTSVRVDTDYTTIRSALEDAVKEDGHA